MVREMMEAQGLEGSLALGLDGVVHKEAAVGHAGLLRRWHHAAREALCAAIASRPRLVDLRRIARSAASENGQGTTEYAILVGILVVIAVLAITVFRPKVQELWDSISSSINAL